MPLFKRKPKIEPVTDKQLQFIISLLNELGHLDAPMTVGADGFPAYVVDPEQIEKATLKALPDAPSMTIDKAGASIIIDQLLQAKNEQGSK